ncbi:MAG TPA: carboxypeptidase-like regulatory domain-containing protein [Gaiellaceae bacterium]|nr:carboxypeptidase-like regulatory domain-containing protein [Gaiellaceae bacterium]
MRWAALVSLAAGVVAALSVAQLAPGQAIERVRVEQTLAPLPTGLYLVLRSPEEYSRAAAGQWVGPAYWLPGEPSVGNTTAITWQVGFDNRPLNTERIALANLSRDWTEDQRAGVSVDHVVGGRVVGTIPGFFVLQVERRSAPAELVLAIPLAPQLHAWVRFLLPRPESDAFLVKGTVAGSSWNRGQALLAMSRVRLDGNLPPSLVTARARRKGRVAGFVVDVHRHAVVGAIAVLERRSGSTWRRIASTRTTRLGGYSFRVRPGSYRVRGTLAGRFSAVSRAVRVRR